jgi:hypothetical protein
MKPFSNWDYFLTRRFILKHNALSIQLILFYETKLLLTHLQIPYIKGENCKSLVLITNKFPFLTCFRGVVVITSA